MTAEQRTTRERLVARGFEVFRGKRRRQHDPAITIHAKGVTLGINAVAYEELGRPSRVVLLFDREDRRIGIRAATEGEEAIAYRITPNRSVIPCRDFTATYGLIFAEPRRLPATIADGVLIAAVGDGERP